MPSRLHPSKGVGYKGAGHEWSLVLGPWQDLATKSGGGAVDGLKG